MCRFLLVKSKNPIKPVKLLKSFSSMAKNSKSFDGDWQGDGWGIAWKKNHTWQLFKSVSPIWENEKKFDEIPETTIFAVHARSASFPKHKNNIEYNQPFINGSKVFVFNGLLKGVTLPYQTTGKIGAQKIWNLLQAELKNHRPNIALNNIKKLLIKYTKKIQALNIGLVDLDEIYSLNYYTKYPDYYKLHYYKDSYLEMICSESFW